VAGVEGLEPSRTVLETVMLPLHHTPIFNFYHTRHGVLEAVSDLKGRSKIPAVEGFIKPRKLNSVLFDALLMLLKILYRILSNACALSKLYHFKLNLEFIYIDLLK
jgi:hypothetical protein